MSRRNSTVNRAAACAPAALSFACLVISCALLFSLVFGCSGQAPTFKDVYLISNDVDGAMFFSGYFNVCLQNASSTTCGPLGSSSSRIGPAINFSKHAVRPYFLLIALCSIAASCLAIAANVLIPVELKDTIRWVGYIAMLFLAISWFATTVAAIWQEVAVHSAIALVGAKRGLRASALVWSGLSLCTVTLVIELVTIFTGSGPKPRQGSSPLSKKLSSYSI